jgi:hypothetical protein
MPALAPAHRTHETKVELLQLVDGFKRVDAASNSANGDAVFLEELASNSSFREVMEAYTGMDFTSMLQAGHDLASMEGLVGPVTKSASEPGTLKKFFLLKMVMDVEMAYYETLMSMAYMPGQFAGMLARRQYSMEDVQNVVRSVRE